MNQTSPPRDGLAQLAEAFRSRRSGLLIVGEEPGALRVLLEAGQITALGPAPSEAKAATPMPKPNDSVRLRLERVLAEIGMRRPPVSAAPKPLGDDASAVPATASLRDRLIAKLADASEPVRFEEGPAPAADLVAVAVATEPLILEAVRQMKQDEAVRHALGDLDRLLIATSALADERTLTLTEGYLLSRIDGIASARQVLELVPLDPSEVERTLLGLMLTGRVADRPAREAHPAAADEPPAAEPVGPAPVEAEAEPEPEPEPFPEPVDAGDIVAEAIPDDEPPPEVFAEDPEVTAPLPAVAPEVPAMDEKTIERRRVIVEVFQSLPLKQNHFDVLGVEPGCTDEAVKRAYITLTKRYHPDANRDKRLNDLHDMLEAIIIRVGEAWEVLGEAKSRASYEARAGIVRRSQVTATPAAGSAAAPATAAATPQDSAEWVPPDEILFRARLALAQANYWEAIQILESALPAMEPRSQQQRGRLLLARAYSKNPNWLRRAEETLQELIREDPTNADAHYELGMVYKTGGFPARAQTMFRRALELRPGHKEASAQLGAQADSASGSGSLLKRLFKRGKAS
jgi:curved DNA-binding protein CbpA